MGLFFVAVGAHAQPAPEGRFPVGSRLSVTPAITFVAGRDSNLLRTNTGEPGREFYLVPQIEGWLGRGRTRVNFVSAVEYHNAPDQNVWNNFSMAQVDLGRGAMVGLHALASRRDHYAPPTDFVGFEIGLKSRRVENTLETTVTFRPGGRVSFGALARKAQLRYDADAKFEGASLQDNLNRDSNLFGGSVALALSPLTAVVGSLDFSRERFIRATERDGNGYRLLGGARFEPLALISGRALLGYMSYTPHLTGDSIGGVAYAVGVSLDRGPVFLDVSGERRVDFGFDPRGFYFSSGIDVYSTVRLARVWETFVRASRRHLTPQGQFNTQEPFRGISLIKTGLAYRLGLYTRVGAEVERYIYGGPGGFDGTRIIGFLTYGSGRFQRLDRPVPGEF
jgi:hypothetical protein